MLMVLSHKHELRDLLETGITPWVESSGEIYSTSAHLFTHRCKLKSGFVGGDATCCPTKQHQNQGQRRTLQQHGALMVSTGVSHFHGLGFQNSPPACVCVWSLHGLPVPSGFSPQVLGFIQRSKGMCCRLISISKIAHSLWLCATCHVMSWHSIHAVHCLVPLVPPNGLQIRSNPMQDKSV